MRMAALILLQLSEHTLVHPPADLHHDKRVRFPEASS